MIDTVMPYYHSRERHSIQLPDAPENIMQISENLTWREVPLFRSFINSLLSKDKKKPLDGKVLDLLLSEGVYQIIYRSQIELLIAGILPTSRKAHKMELGRDVIKSFQEIKQNNITKVVANFMYRDGVLSTETRNFSIGKKARLIFSAYWFMIRPGSGIIRRLWLNGIRRRVAKEKKSTIMQNQSISMF